MLEITNTNGLVLELLDSYSVTVEKFNPLFNDPDKFFQDISYPGQAPMSPANKIFFKNSHLIETPNESYEQTVYVNLSGISLFEAQCVYQVNEESFEFTLKPNYAAVANQLQTGYLTELHTNDANYAPQSSAEFKALMLDTCKHPAKYPYIYFPVYNDKFNSAPDYNSPGGQHQIVNDFDYDNQTFRIWEPFVTVDFAETPFFKVSHVIAKALESLGFASTGDFFTDPDDTSIYIYTRRAGTYFLPRQSVLPSSCYMPNMLIKDFLTGTRQRMHLAFDFDLAGRTCEVQSFKSLVASPVALDLTSFLDSVTDMTVPDQKGYTVYLKPDEQDGLTSYEPNDENKARPDFRLIVGDGQTDVPLECSTLKNAVINGGNGPGKYVRIQQPLVNVNFKSYANFDDVDPADPATFNQWPLKLIRYNGFNDYGSGKGWPDSVPFDLDNSDIAWYQFLNDCKQAILHINIPPVILSQLKLTRKYSFISREGNYTECIIEKIDYTVSSKSTDLMAVDVYIKTLNNQATTKAIIEPWPEPVEHNDNLLPIGLLIKSYFSEELHGISTLQLQIVNLSGSNWTFHVDPITQPTNKNGIGGSGCYLQQDNYLKNAFGASFIAEIRISQGNPRFLEYLGKRYPFASAGNYFYTQVYFDIDAGITSCWITY